jgi:hypothetical protein
MRALLLAIFVLGAIVPASTASADRCRAHCRDRARACKLRCKMGHPEGASESRHRCLQTCEMHEADCRVRC